MLDIITLSGNWHFRREITHQQTIFGTAILTQQDSHQLHYREEGTRIMHDKKVTRFYREYLYQQTNKVISVYFIEGNALRLFHVLNFKNKHEAAGFHLCGADSYHADYQFDESAFSIRYAVSGPRKQYISTTSFVKQTAGNSLNAVNRAISQING